MGGPGAIQREEPPEQGPPPRLITSPVIFVAGLLLGISTLAFFRVPLLPAIGDELSLSAVEVGTITVAFALGRLATDLPAGSMADRVPPATSYLWAGLIMAAGSLLLSQAGSTAVTWVAAFVIGVASSIANTTGMSYFSRSGDRSNRGRYMALFSTALLSGQALGPTLGGLLAGLGSWRTSQVAATILALVFAGACLWVIRRQPARLGNAVALPATPAAGHGATESATPAIPFLHLAIIFSVGFTVFFTIGGMTQTLIPLIGDDRLGQSASVIGLALGLGGLFRLAGGLAGGFISDRYSRKAALLPGLATSAAGVLVVAFWTGTGGWLSSIVLISVGSIGIATAGTMLGDRTGKGRSGRVFGQYRFVGDLGLLAGPLASTLLYSEVGYRAPLFLTAGLLIACFTSVALLLPEHSEE